MSFVERLTTLVVESLIHVLVGNKTTVYVDRLAPDRPPLYASQLLLQASRFQTSGFMYGPGWLRVTCPKGHLSEGSFVRNVVVQILKFDAKPNPKLTMALTLTLTNCNHNLAL